MKTINIDIETYSDADLSKVGVYKYADSTNFEVLLFAYAIDGGEPTCVDLTIDELPEAVVAALTDEGVLKIAFNAQFERVCLSRLLGVTLDAKQWRCTMVQAQVLGLPASLAGCGAYLRVDAQKSARGRQLIQFFSKPCLATKKNGGRTRNLPAHDEAR